MFSSTQINLLFVSYVQCTSTWLLLFVWKSLWMSHLSTTLCIWNLNWRQFFWQDGTLDRIQGNQWLSWIVWICDWKQKDNLSPAYNFDPPLPLIFTLFSVWIGRIEDCWMGNLFTSIKHGELPVCPGYWWIHYGWRNRTLAV